jgi:hypothetical protein
MDKNNKQIKDEKPSGTNTEIESSAILLTDEPTTSNPINKLLEEAFVFFDKANEENKNGFACLKKIQKLISKITNKKPKIKKLTGINEPKKLSGFSESTVVPNELKLLLNIHENTLPRTKLTKKVYEYIEANNLKCPNNKRILRVNDKLANALKLTKEQVEKINNSNNQKDKEGLNFYNIQTWISKLYPNNKNIKQGDKNIKQVEVPIVKNDNVKNDNVKNDNVKNDNVKNDNVKNDNVKNYIKKEVIELKFDKKEKNPINNLDLNINVKKEKRKPILLCDDPNENNKDNEDDDEILIVRKKKIN